MPTMTDSELSALLDAEKSDALAGSNASKLSDERETAMRYYKGDLSKDMPPMEGKSRATSSDVADTIDGLMPDLMDIFAGGGDSVVQFEPVGPEDEQVAMQETDYVNHVFLQKNDGWLVLHNFMKDALISKTGVVKLWTEEEEKETSETYLDQPSDAYGIIVADPELEVVEHTEHDGLHDVKVVCRKTYKCQRVAVVPPEEFGISRHARTIRDAGYVFHETRVRQSELIAQGYDEKQVKDLPSYDGTTNSEVEARDTVDEHEHGGDGNMNEANRLITVTEHTVRMDYEKTGNAKLYMVTTAGKGEVLRKDGKKQIIEVPRIKFAAITPVIIPHRFIGRSVAELVTDIMQIKTALMRGMLDNLYGVVSPRPVVAETEANAMTLDDLLLHRPGAPIRAKTTTAVVWQEMPFVGDSVLPVMQFLDATREWRTGVTRQGQGVDPNALQNQVATIANQMYNAAQKKVRMIARIFAETGIKDMFSLLHAEIRENADAAAVVKLRNQWVTVNPRDWKERNDMTVNVGLGEGSKAEQMAQTTVIANFQKEALLGGLTQLVTPKNLFNTASDLARLAGKKNPDMYFTDPSKPPDPQNPPLPEKQDPKIIELQTKAQIDQQQMVVSAQIEQAQLQHKAEIEKLQALADIQTQKDKTQAEIVIMQADFEFKKQLALMQHQLEREKLAMQLQAQGAEMQMKHEASLKETEARTRPPVFQLDANEAVKDMQPAMESMTAATVQALTQASAALTVAAQALAAPTELIVDPQTGRPIGSRKVLPPGTDTMQ